MCVKLFPCKLWIFLCQYNGRIMRQKAMNTEKNVMNVIQLLGSGGWMDAECSIFRVFVFQRRVCVLLLCTKKRIKSIAKVKKPAIGTFNRPSVCQSPKHIELVRSNTLDLFEVNLCLFITR